jgi:hypothetical protein
MSAVQQAITNIPLYYRPPKTSTTLQKKNVLMQKLTVPTLLKNEDINTKHRISCHMKLWGHHIAALLPLFSSLLQSQQRSLAACISILLAKRIFGSSASQITSAGHAYQHRYLTNGEANQTAKNGKKEARFPAASSSRRGLPKGWECWVPS